MDAEDPADGRRTAENKTRVGRREHHSQSMQVLVENIFKSHNHNKYEIRYAPTIKFI
jgi:hypothetical protein